MTHYKIAPRGSCRSCRGTGIAVDWVDWWGSSVPKPFDCDCVTDQLPVEFNERKDTYEIVRDIFDCEVIDDGVDDPYEFWADY